MTTSTPIPEAMIEAAAKALHEYDRQDGEPGWDGLEPWDRNSYEMAVTRVLAAVLSLCESHTEWASEHTGDLKSFPSPYVMETGRDEWGARIRVKAWREDRPDVTTRLLRRTVTVVYGEWEPVEDGEFR